MPAALSIKNNFLLTAKIQLLIHICHYLLQRKRDCYDMTLSSDAMLNEIGVNLLTYANARHLTQSCSLYQSSS